jgi:hypothetical protein
VLVELGTQYLKFELGHSNGACPALTRQKKITLGEMPAPSADLLPGLSIGVIFALPTASKQAFH